MRQPEIRLGHPAWVTVNPTTRNSNGALSSCSAGLSASRRSVRSGMCFCPGGTSAISRWLSGATPPDRTTEKVLNPGGIQENDGWSTVVGVISEKRKLIGRLPFPEILSFSSSNTIDSSSSFSVVSAPLCFSLFVRLGCVLAKTPVR